MFIPLFFLSQTKDFDLIIVGAGLTGLSSAFHLKERNPSLKICILDKEKLANGSSSRNSGNFGVIYPENLSIAYQTLVSNYTETIKDIAKKVESVAPDIKLRPSQCFMVSKHSEKFQTYQSKLQKLNIAVKIEEGKEKIAELCGFQDNHYSQILTYGQTSMSMNPYKFMMGIVKHLHANYKETMTFFENTKLTKIDDDGMGCVVQNNKGETRNLKSKLPILIATNTYSPFHLETLKNKFYRFFLVAGATQKLSKQQFDQLGEFGRRKGEIFLRESDWDEINATYFVSDDRVCFRAGAYFHETLFGEWETLPAAKCEERAKKNLSEILKKRFPQLDFKFEKFWTCPMGMFSSFYPVFGKIPIHPNEKEQQSFVYASVGYGAEGIGASVLCGKLMAEYILEKDETKWSKQLSWVVEKWNYKLVKGWGIPIVLAFFRLLHSNIKTTISTIKFVTKNKIQLILFFLILFLAIIYRFLF